MKKISYLALSISTLLLAGCGSESESPGVIVDGEKYTVIDGYINNAMICVKEPVKEPRSEAACVYSTTTNSNGVFTLPNQYKGYLVTAHVVGGVSSDSDTVGVSPRSYSMSAAEGETNITPFSTMSAMSDVTDLADIAAELGVEVEALTQDYVDVDNGNAKVHLYARTLASQLMYQDDVDQSESLLSVAKATKVLVEQLEGQDPNIDFSDITVNIKNDDGGNPIAEDVPRVSSLEDFLEHKVEGEPAPVYGASLNFAYFVGDDEGVQTFLYEDGVVKQYKEDGALDFTGEYTISGDQVEVRAHDESETDQFIYVSNDIALGVPIGDRDLGVTAQEPLIKDGRFSDDELVNKTHYFLVDESDNKSPDPMMVKIEYGTEKATLTDFNQENGKFDEVFGTVSYEINGEGAVVIKLTELGDDTDTVMFKSIENQHMLVGYDVNHQTFSLNFFDEEFAIEIYKRWADLTK
ncbi:hypothetical protein [Vibrio methylphosphonaticus]|uniref:hypothetical protein n=1 Tax=Vibrio methylphosphonaticus TaxID=2946866 RepID=UPI00202AC21D|nr:hypothetical protein [Vibrio methylphosphonaticus]MCL9775302.1 hypothetical protein [Vibrio methylphosphonaticus]